jgi:hypothetical protein
MNWVASAVCARVACHASGVAGDFGGSSPQEVAPGPGVLLMLRFLLNDSQGSTAQERQEV